MSIPSKAAAKDALTRLVRLSHTALLPSDGCRACGEWRKDGWELGFRMTCVSVVGKIVAHYRVSGEARDLAIQLLDSYLRGGARGGVGKSAELISTVAVAVSTKLLTHRHIKYKDFPQLRAKEAVAFETVFLSAVDLSLITPELTPSSLVHTIALGLQLWLKPTTIELIVRALWATVSSFFATPLTMAFTVIETLVPKSKLKAVFEKLGISLASLASTNNTCRKHLRAVAVQTLYPVDLPPLQPTICGAGGARKRKRNILLMERQI